MKSNNKKKYEDYNNLKINPNLITNSKDAPTSKQLNNSIKIDNFLYIIFILIY